MVEETAAEYAHDPLILCNEAYCSNPPYGNDGLGGDGIVSSPVYSDFRVSCPNPLAGCETGSS